MRKIRSRASLCVAVLALFLVGLAVLLASYVRNARTWFMKPYNRHIYSQENVLMTGTVCDRNGVVLSYVSLGQRFYNEDPAIRRTTLHVVGDPYGKIGTSVLATMRDYLAEYDPLAGASAITDKGNTVMLSIDAEANAAALEALSGRNGTVCVYNYKTGEILVLVSTPAYDPSAIPEDIESSAEYNGAYMNRFIQSTATPGSVMKTVILQAALEKLSASDVDPSLSGPITECTFRCTGSVEFPDGTIRCPKAHGAQTLQEAFANSCNCTFAGLANLLGEDTVSLYIQKAGLTDSYKVGTLNTAWGGFSVTGVGPYRLGSAGIGLYLDQVNPCSLLVYYAAIANGGTAAIPNPVLNAVDQNGKTIYKPKVQMSATLIEASTAAQIRKMLLNNVVATYGADRFPCTIGAKTGTVSRSSGASDCWFAGYVAEESTPYAFVVYMEHGGSGSGDAGEVAAVVLRALLGK